MGRFLIRRLGHGLCLLLALAAGTLLLGRLVPGDHLAEQRLGSALTADEEQNLRRQDGLDDPWHERLARDAGSWLRGEMGRSLSHRVPVRDLVVPRLGQTLLLAGGALVLSWGLALPLGLAMARRPRSLGGRAILAGTSLPLSIPELLIALGALYLAASTGWFPTGGASSLGGSGLDPWSRLLDRLHHLALPLLVLTLGALPSLVRHVRGALLEALGAPFVEVARGHGLGEATVLWRYALPAAASPLVALFGLSVARLLSGSMLVEVVFGWPGLGPLMLDALFARDLPVVQAVVLLGGVLLLLGNLLADLLVWWLDPRQRDALAGATGWVR